ncbi:hypothetical protein ACFWE5_16015 [Cellulosimicrobium funkei]|uniref:hypothetical protein n=1 Tax=Cellulosimicrobium funkei TaxID=264251 RepID=UPI0036532400
MRCATTLGAAAIASALLLAGAPGSTHALWRDETALAGATLTAGALDVDLAPQQALVPVLMEPDRQVSTAYRLTTTVVGDNLAARLRLGVPAWRDAMLLEALDVGVAVAVPGGPTVTGALDPNGALLFDGSPDVPIDVPPGTEEISVTLTVGMHPWAGNTYQGQQLPDAELVADLSQVRDGEQADAHRLWHDVQSTPAPAVSTVSPEVDLQAVDPPTETFPDPASDSRPALDAPATETPAGDVPTDDPAVGTEQAPASPDADEAAGPAEDQAAVVPDDPPWAAELLTLLEDAGIDPATLDLDAPLPAPVEQWAADRAVPTTDVVAWLRERQP